MANYTIETQYPDTEVIGGNLTQDVQVVGVRTIPHGVYFETRLPRKIATTTNIRLQAAGLATHYEQLFDIDGVSTITWTQEPTAAGLLEDHLLVYVTSTSGNSEGVLDFPYSQFANDVIAAAVAKLRAGLDATEAT